MVKSLEKSSTTRLQTMETGTLKGLELALIAGVVLWFYFRQMGQLKSLKQQREAKQESDAEGGKD
jgi:hypothetical protein